jgi:ATP-dependent helicase/nuclease subunit A
MEETDIVQDHPDAHIEHEPEKLPPVPKFISPAETSEDMRGAMRGTWYHRILELHDYGREGTAADWKSEVTEMVNGGFVPKETLTAIDFNKLENFCRSDIGQRMKQAALQGTLKREQAFVMGVPADTIQAEYPASETVLIQGIIDAFFEEEDGIVLVDYKTDRVGTEDGEEVLKSRYGIQLRYYADAITRGTGKKVKECVIYSFALQKSVPL